MEVTDGDWACCVMLSVTPVGGPIDVSVTAERGARGAAQQLWFLVFRVPVTGGQVIYHYTHWLGTRPAMSPHDK